MRGEWNALVCTHATLLAFAKCAPVNSKYTWKDNLAAIFEAKLKAAIDNRGVKK